MRAVAVAGLGLAFVMMVAALTGCDVKYDCEGCTVKLDVPLPSCLVYKNGEIMPCPDAGPDGDDGGAE